MLIDWLQSDLQTINMVCNDLYDNLLTRLGIIFGYFVTSYFSFSYKNNQANNIGQSPASEKAWLEYTKAKESFILRLFYGQIKSTVKCKICGEESATFDTFSNLSLELPMINIERCHIMDCFNLYFNGENISGWNCPRCKVPRDAVKKLDISKLPPVLVIHLKRFYADSYSFRKKSIYVEFPYADLDMLQYVSPKERMSVSGTNHVYNLYAVSNHYGTMESGHYTGKKVI